MADTVPRVSGILESSLYVADLDRSREFYQRLFGFEQFMCDGRMCALGVPGEQVLLLFRHGATDQPAPAPGGFIPPHHGRGALHLCFAIPYRRAGGLGGASAGAGHRDGKPAVLAAWRHQPVFPRPGRAFAGGGHAGSVAEPLMAGRRARRPRLTRKFQPGSRSSGNAGSRPVLGLRAPRTRAQPPSCQAGEPA